MMIVFVHGCVFIIGCVSNFIQNVYCFSPTPTPSSFNHDFELILWILTFPCLWEISFSRQMIPVLELSVGYWASR